MLLAVAPPTCVVPSLASCVLMVTASEGATVASTVTYLLPVVAIVLGVLILDETITVITLAGIALVLAGVALTRRRVKAASNEIPVE
jgi:drug/metabolite transporter (DMT)-like permease